jgi:thiol-disulfide isomerase/thioredoxin
MRGLNMQNNLLRKSVVFGKVLVMVAVMFAPVTMNVCATCSGAGSTETVANVDRIENATRIIAKEGTFNIGQGEIQYENGKPVIRLFSTTWCPHCPWITDTFDNVIKEYVQTGQIVAYHWDLDSGDNTLTDDVETEVPQSELAVFQTFNPGGSIPTFVFGNKYWRIGNGYEGQNDLIAEEAEFRRIIEKLVQNEGSTFDEREEVITFRIGGVSNGDHSSVTPEDECEYEWDGLVMDSPSDSNISTLDISSYEDPPPCEINGCGPEGYKLTHIAAAIAAMGLDPTTCIPTVLFYYSLLFEECCNRHDRCYCHGEVTYCYTRHDCDTKFRDEMKAACADHYDDLEDACLILILEPISYRLCKETASAEYLACKKAADVFYEAVDRYGDGSVISPEKQTCYDYYGWGGEWECPADLTTVYVDGDAGCPQRGTEGKPVSTVTAGKEKVALGGTVIIAAGSYPESIVISKSMTLEASGGSVVIGE